MSDLVILVILVAVGLISSLIKASKKKIENSIPMEPVSRQDDSDPWEEIIREARRYQIAEPIVEPEEEHDEEERKAELLNQKRMEEVKNRRSISGKARFQANDDNAQKEEDTHIKDFNARDAVIYSEILKPKF